MLGRGLSLYSALPRASVVSSLPSSSLTTPQSSFFSTSRPLSKRPPPPLESILVANRGEIACRIMRTAKKLGIRTIAVYSEADSLSQHVEMADESVCIGPPPSADSYLRIDRIMEAIQQTKAAAVHPGYGFLSERSAFVEELEKNNVIFIGPGSHAMNAMGDKIESKKIAKAAGVNVIPGFIGEVDDSDEVIRLSKEIGYPVMVKASAGGGGKGLRIAWNDEEVVEAFHVSKAEAIASFGDGRMLIEKFVDEPRHIEIQILMDQNQNGVYLPERECSVQRRNQKVVEEAPSPFIDEATRKAMGEQAVALAKAVDYKSAGTVEMLVDSKRNFYFLEMNTRLQVEHPVTEQISNLDLVEEMIRIAAGEPLRPKQEDIKPDGWSFESRIYAENPLRGFLPSTGLLTHYSQPGEYLEGHPQFDHPKALRCDSGIREGSEISMYYDPMISKLITWGKDRTEASDRMKTALDAYKIRGLKHNVNFCRDLLDNPAFISGKYTTNFIPEQYPDGFNEFLPTGKRRTNLIAASAVMQYLRTLKNETINDKVNSFEPVETQELYIQISTNDENDVFERVRITGDDYEPLGAIYDSVCDLQFVNEAGEAESSVGITWNWKDSTMFHAHIYKDGVELLEDGSATEPSHDEIFVQMIEQRGTGFLVSLGGMEYTVKCLTPAQHELHKHMKEKEKPDLSKFLLSPMPGRVVSTHVEAGKKVEEGEKVVILEAMKMQNVLRAEKAGVVKAIHVQTDDQVADDEILIEWEE
eukprot:CAMPEP_0201523692 /NCGR_PEP_ID=MMETSP0161_2-20130828/20782_1 /ASSEMBLY_ACC=CAM_ASM_000251 /TAXON_ID=180227 /ORGANISM="Neoparamoeba aestuarina, Strain SoJaBio B1-5/56/2" /LENGTH=754 /DNA_ID=CAMNT_0047922883 /DNA_START=52 /DNA_END=2316 /DNA_ORIENTATION=+